MFFGGRPSCGSGVVYRTVSESARTGRGRVSPAAWRVLLVAAISAATLPALLLTPYGGDVAQWWLD